MIADAQKAKGLAPLTCKTDKTDARVLAVLSERRLVPEIWLPDPTIRRERELARFRLHLVVWHMLTNSEPFDIRRPLRQRTSVRCAGDEGDL